MKLSDSIYTKKGFSSKIIIQVENDFKVKQRFFLIIHYHIQ